MLWSTTTAPTHSALACPSLNILPVSVRSAPYSPETRSVCTIWRDTYGRGHHPKDAPYTSGGCYRCREPNHLVKDCPHRLDVQRLTTEQREELIEDLMALKDAVAEEEVGSSPEEDFV